MIHRTPPEDSRAAGWVDLDAEWEITTLPLVDPRYGLDNGGSVLARNTYADGIEAARRLGGQLPTPAQLKAKAKLPGAIVLTPFLGTPIAETSLHHSKLHDADVDRQLREKGWTGKEPVVGAGKHWVDPDDDEETGPDEDADLDEWSHLCGWDKDGDGPSDELWQPRMKAHKGRNHHDDGTTTEVVRKKGAGTMNETPPPSSSDNPPAPPTPDSGEDSVKEWQLFLRQYFTAKGLPDPLPKYGVDGDDGDETKAATKRWQDLENEPADIYDAIDDAVEIVSEPPPTEPSPLITPGSLWWEDFLAAIPFKQAQSYYPARRLALEGICMHVAVTAEVSTVDEALQDWAAGGKIGVSWGYAVDNDSWRQSVRDEHTAWACPGLNSSRIQIELAGDIQTAAQWDDAYSRAVITNAAKLTAALCLKHNFPIHWNDFAELLAHKRGITDHNEGRLALLEAKKRNLRIAPWWDGRPHKQCFKSTTHIDLGRWFPREKFLSEVHGFCYG